MIEDGINKWLAGEIESPEEEIRVLKGWVLLLQQRNEKLAQEVDNARMLAKLIKEFSS